ncbi:MAG: hypothetical protein ACOYEV_11845 [Candidatus Nanopelagicales bacterium]
MEPVELGHGQPESYVTAIGDISISPHWVNTPSGQFPLRGTTWTVTDLTQRNERIAPAGIILAILFIWACLLSLLFLLMKERSVSGYIQVTVHGSGFHHTTMIPAASEQTIWEITQSVNLVRSMAATA